jgi:phenylacetate-coenzyme A ligase PaaK-like adenylate-forming protein
MFSDGGKTKHYHQQLRRQTSSGSTGMPITVYWDASDYFSTVLPLWRKRMLYYGIHPEDRFINFTLNAFNSNGKSENVLYKQLSANELSINVTHILNTGSFKEIVGIIDSFAPKWLYIQPGILQKLIYAFEQLGTKPHKSLTYIESVGELLSTELREKAVDFFEVPLSNMYGSEEFNGIAYECPYHNMHILTDCVFVECLDRKGVARLGSGEIIVTSLTNRYMPIIRYNLRDVVEIESIQGECPCGSVEPIIAIIKGRSSEYILIDDSVELSSYLFAGAIAEINNQFSDIISRYCFIYSKGIRELICHIELAHDRASWFQNVKLAILKLIKERITEEASLNFDVVLGVPKRSFAMKQRSFQIIE